MTEKYRTKVGSKGQVVVAKELREKYGIKEGGLVEQISTENGVLLIPLLAKDLLKELDDVAEVIGKAWPKKGSAVEAIREDRERQ
ncbi:AbrB/MazE/SpoVT family DNA-binding domain-containing protein [Candidatus Bathyarchaeota archaeon CG_4_8_14_3_um_filter_42_8]|nr:MAG: AbrB/MazE/SpoVT family DNA-binding domain-containing protein [Candidatus Bathyarchaeota archaeon CG_4_8_14_3_um_filter_42_8]